MGQRLFFPVQIHEGSQGTVVGKPLQEVPHSERIVCAIQGAEYPVLYREPAEQNRQN